MGRIALLARLARHDMRRRFGDAVLLTAALTVAAASLALGLALHGRTAAPYAYTRAQTRGPDVVAGVLAEPGSALDASQRTELTAVLRDPAVARRGGPFVTTWTPLTVGHLNAAAEVQGRPADTSPVDRPVVTAGTWVRPGRAVVEQAFAAALHVHVGSVLHLGSRTFRVSGIAVTAAVTPFPDVCFLGCSLATPALASSQPGLVWLTQADARSLATRREPIALFAYVVLRPGVPIDAFMASHTRPAVTTAPLLTSWHDIERHDDKIIRNERLVLVLGGSLLSLLSIATLAVLVGGRLSRETRRIGLFKAVGATPGFVVLMLLVQYVVIAALAAVLGTTLALAIAPDLDTTGSGLLGSARPTSIGAATFAAVLAVMTGLTVLSVAGAAYRAARTSTVSALDGSSQVPRRRRLVVALSARLPTAGLLGLRLVARRPRRSVLAAAGVAVAVCGGVVALLSQARLGLEHATGTAGPSDPHTARLDHVLFALTVLLIVLAVVDIVFIASATAAEAQASLATSQALGASPTMRLGALATALAVPAAAGTVLGLPCGIGLFSVLDHSSTNGAIPLPALILVGPVTIVATAALAAITDRLTNRRPLAQVLQVAA